jgi:hypothetical protein
MSGGMSSDDLDPLLQGGLAMGLSPGLGSPASLVRGVTFASPPPHSGSSEYGTFDSLSGEVASISAPAFLSSSSAGGNDSKVLPG